MKKVLPKLKIDYIRKFRNKLKYGWILESLFEIGIVVLVIGIMLIIALIKLK